MFKTVLSAKGRVLMVFLLYVFHCRINTIDLLQTTSFQKMLTLSEAAIEFRPTFISMEQSVSSFFLFFCMVYIFVP